MITTEELDYMLNNPGVCMTNEPGNCTVHYASGDHSFVMRGPTGIHILFASATDLDRLNAHWFVFAGNRS